MNKLTTTITTRIHTQAGLLVDSCISIGRLTLVLVCSVRNVVESLGESRTL